MLKSLLKFELGYQARQIAFWVVIIVMALYGVMIALLPDIFGSGLAGSRLKANGAQMIAGGISAAYLPIIFFGGVFTVTGILRDKTSNMLEIIHATPVSTRDMTMARMIGIFSIITIAFLIFLIAQFLGQFSPTLDEQSLGPIKPLYYLQPFVLFTVINALFVTAFFTFIAGITQNRVAVLVSAIGLFFFSLMVPLAAELDAPKWLQAIIDPFAAVAYELDTGYWSPDEFNNKLVPLTGYTGLNRLVWTLISLGALLLVFTRFKRGLVTGKTKLNRDANMVATGDAYRGVAPRTGFAADVASLWTRTKFEYLSTVRSIPFLILAALAASLFALLVIITVFFSPQKLVPTGQFMVGLGFASLLIPMLLIVSFFAAESMFRDKGAKFTELLDSTRVSNWPLLVSKWLALSAVVATLCIICMCVGMLIQGVTDGPAIDPGLYLRFTFFNAMPNYLFMAALALIVQIFVPNRIVGMLVAAGALVLTQFFIGILPFYHPLMGFNGTSPGSISEISPYNSWVYFRWFNGYWALFCTAMAVLGVWLWRRGLQTGLMTRLSRLRGNITPISGAILALAVGGFIATGTYIYRAYDVANWTNSKTTEALQVEAEKLFTREYGLPRPHVRSVLIEADLYPSRQDGTVSGTMLLENMTGAPITELYVQPGTAHAEDMRRFEIKGATLLTEGENADGDDVKRIADLGANLFVFEPPLAPGAKTELTFETYLHAPRLADRSVVSKNGTFVNNYGSFRGSQRVIPVLGVPDTRIQSTKKRRKLDLPEREKLPRPTAEGTDINLFGLFSGPSDGIDFEGRICTEAPQIPIAPGNLISEETVDGRTCRTYRTTQPISNFFSILSGDYAVTTDSWTSPDGKVIPINIYHDEAHTYSVEDMTRAAKFSLSHYSEHFSPYPYDYFRIMEVPFINFAQAFAGTIPYAEQGFVMDSGEADDIKTLDNAALTTMHEMGHQWFAHQIVPGQALGFNVLSEGLTSYATTDAYEAMYGWDKTRYMMENATIAQMEALAFIDSEKDVPLALAEGQQYLVYNKADWVLWGLKHYIGPQNMRDAMKGFLQEYGLKGPPYPTTKTVTDLLREVAGPEYNQLITDQWDRITWWKFSIGHENGETDATVTENPDGTWRVTIPLLTDKVIQTEEMENSDSWTEIDGESLREPVEIGIYSDEPKTLWSAWDKLELVWVEATETTLTFDVDTQPTHIAIDPRRLLQERNIDDNVQTLTVTAAQPS